MILRDAIGGSNDVLVAGITGTTTALAALLSRPLLKRAATSTAGLKIGMWVGVVGYVLGTTAFVTDIWQLIPIAAIALGAASGTILTAGLAITESIADPSNRGALNATFYFAAYVGMAMPVVITFIARAPRSTSPFGWSRRPQPSSPCNSPCAAISPSPHERRSLRPFPVELLPPPGSNQ